MFPDLIIQASEVPTGQRGIDRPGLVAALITAAGAIVAAQITAAAGFAVLLVSKLM
jgi:hypothetical protein